MLRAHGFPNRGHLCFFLLPVAILARVFRSAFVPDESRVFQMVIKFAIGGVLRRKRLQNGGEENR